MPVPPVLNPPPPGWESQYPKESWVNQNRVFLIVAAVFAILFVVFLVVQGVS